jgi:hypothetical protein
LVVRYKKYIACHGNIYAQNTKELTESTVEDSERDKILGPWPAELTPKMFFLFSLPKRRPVKMHKKSVIKKETCFQKEGHSYNLAAETEDYVIDQTRSYPLTMRELKCPTRRRYQQG